ncbi:MAG TPA: MFS transporter, partial [Ilumatobacteraceae bacterium]|nr:MFS transporter [Ilumatobacteraceae bacterium]
MSGTFDSLKIRNYRVFAVGTLISNTGTWMQRVAQDWLVLKLTDGSAGALGITTGLQFLPTLLFSATAGVCADRYSKRKLLVLAQFAMGISAAVLGVLAVTGTARTWHVYVIAFLFGTASAFEV